MQAAQPQKVDRVRYAAAIEIAGSNTDQVVAARVGVRCAAAEGRQGAEVRRLPLHIPRQPHLDPRNLGFSIDLGYVWIAQCT